MCLRYNRRNKRKKVVLMTIKKFSLLAIASLSLLSLAACDMDDKDDHMDNQPKTSQTSKKVKLSEDKAKSIAFKDASVAEADAQMVTVSQENEDGKAVYDIEFHHKDKEYSYTIDANTGDIVEKSSEPVNE
ncbi:UNVERIFIED_CONTAM: PepSY domain-containing protein [Streptococcus canis]|nr:PepSY domain-containing protein [Streptococcus canis]MDV5972516.1 PepSY domain-containing protein [Streptococcus canis]MDV5988843.1 PepSY domain-containing protein [Streptococcus canis]MDV5994070.1 PepSY domain-containing protein [Streptococcus canis]MDV6022593.1 PepSY domain-containing protein [Streptococcus canis]QKG76174.1 PepSY domain-containing protein [Streptococcus canis]